MYTQITHKGKSYEINLSKPIDISIPIQNGLKNPNAFHAPPVEFKPLISGDFTGSIVAGSPVNFYNIQLNPHGNGTHTECVGHISAGNYTINGTMDRFFFPAQLITITPEAIPGGDRVIAVDQVSSRINPDFCEALLIRTLPNDATKRQRQYTGTNPPYMHHQTAKFIAEAQVQHLLIDLPSVDREEDEGLLLAHHAYWQYPKDVRQKATITELIYVPNEIPDGLYFLNIQIASFELDVSPSKPLLFEIGKN